MFVYGHNTSVSLSCQEFLYRFPSFFKIRPISAVNDGEIKAFVYSFREEAILKDLDWYSIFDSVGEKQYPLQLLQNVVCVNIAICVIHH